MKLEVSAGLKKSVNFAGQLLLMRDPVDVAGGLEVGCASASKLGRAVSQQHLTDTIKFEETLAPVGWRRHEEMLSGEQAMLRLSRWAPAGPPPAA